MTLQLKKVIQEKLEHSGMNSSELERKAGLSASSVRKIILGKYENPKLETLHAIASVFNCSIDELVGRNIINSHQKITTQNKNIPFSSKLFLKITQETINLYEQHSKEFTLEDFINFAIEAYQYCFFQKNGELDLPFIEWFFGQKFLQ